MESFENLSGIPCVPESALAAGLAARLPETVPGPPWHCRVEVVIWCHRASGAAIDALPAPLRSRATGPLTIGMMVRYLDSPVGAYTEIAASSHLVRGRPLRAHVPFIAVDSFASLHAGRTNWAMPKAWADFAGHPADGTPMSGSGDGWRVGVTPHAYGPRLPLAAASGVEQVRADGSSLSMPVRLAGLGRLARVDTDVTSTGALAQWLRPGRHTGVLISRARLTVGAPR